MANTSERSYIAFISYRHKPLDKAAAEKIQKCIEHYTIPRELRKSPGDKKMGMVFRDEDELPASASLSDSITEALDHSRYLIVICTPDLPESKWCEQEIRYFLRTHDRDHVLAVLADGEPENSFSPYLLHTYDEDGNIIGNTEPLAANIAGPGHTIDQKAFKKEIVRIYAALLGCPFDTLWQREKRAKATRLSIAAGAAAAVMAAFTGTVLMKNAQIGEKNRQLSAQISTALVDNGIAKLEEYDRKAAEEYGMQALLSDGEADLYDRRADKLLADARNAYTYFDPVSSLIYSQSVEITDMAVVLDMEEMTDEMTVEYIVDHGRYNVLRFLDVETGTANGEVMIEDDEMCVASTNHTEANGYGTAFSKTGKYFACELEMVTRDMSADLEHTKYEFRIFLIDPEKFEIIDDKYWIATTDSAATVIYGISVDEATRDIFAAHYDLSMGGIVADVIRDDGRKLLEELTNAAIAKETVDTWSVQLLGRQIPMLAGEQVVLLCSQNTLYVFAKETGKLVKSYSFTGDIIDMQRMSTSDLTVELILDNGLVQIFNFTDKTDDILGSMYYTYLDQKGISYARPVRDGLLQNETDGMFLTVQEERPTHLLRADYATDPAGVFLEGFEGEELYSPRMHAAPDGKTYMIASHISGGKTRAAVYDAATDKLLAKQDFDEYFDNEIHVMDAEHFVNGCKIYAMDGTWQYLECVTDDNAYKYNYYMVHTATADGHLLSFAETTGNSFIPVWIDGKLLSFTNREETALGIPGSELQRAGGNGYVMGYGKYKYSEDGETYVVAESAAFAGYDTVNEKRIIVECADPQAEVKELCLGTEKPLLAAVDTGGSVRIYSLENAGSFFAAEAAYAPEEVQLMRFTQGDEYLVIMTRSGSIDIFETEGGKKVYSEYIIDDTGFLDDMSIMRSPEGDRVFIGFYTGDSQSRVIGLDIEHQTIFLDEDRTIGCSPDKGQIYKAYSSGVIIFSIQS